MFDSGFWQIETVLQVGRFNVIFHHLEDEMWCIHSILKKYKIYTASGVARIFQGGGGGGARRGNEATDRGRVWEGCPPSHGREIF